MFLRHSSLCIQKISTSLQKLWCCQTPNTHCLKHKMNLMGLKKWKAIHCYSSNSSCIIQPANYKLTTTRYYCNNCKGNVKFIPKYQRRIVRTIRKDSAVKQSLMIAINFSEYSTISLVSLRCWLLFQSFKYIYFSFKQAFDLTDITVNLSK